MAFAALFFQNGFSPWPFQNVILSECQDVIPRGPLALSIHHQDLSYIRLLAEVIVGRGENVIDAAPHSPE